MKKLVGIGLAAAISFGAFRLFFIRRKSERLCYSGSDNEVEFNYG